MRVAGPEYAHRVAHRGVRRHARHQPLPKSPSPMRLVDEDVTDPCKRRLVSHNPGETDLPAAALLIDAEAEGIADRFLDDLAPPVPGPIGVAQAAADKVDVEQFRLRADEEFFTLEFHCTVILGNRLRRPNGLIAPGRRPNMRVARGRRSSAARSAGNRCGRSPALHEPQVGPDAPAQAPPERPTGGVVGKEKQVALGNVLRPELPEAVLHQLPSDAPPPPLPGHGKVVQVSPPAVMAAQHRGYHSPA